MTIVGEQEYDEAQLSGCQTRTARDKLKLEVAANHVTAAMFELDLAFEAWTTGRVDVDRVRAVRARASVLMRAADAMLLMAARKRKPL